MVEKDKTCKIKYMNIEINGVDHIDIKNLPDGKMEVDFLNMMNKVGSLVLEANQVKHTVFVCDGNVGAVSIVGKLFIFGNGNITKISGSLFQGDGSLVGIEEAGAGVVQKTSDIGAQSRLKEIDDQRGYAIKILGDLKSIKYVHDKNIETAQVNVAVVKDVKKATIIGQVHGALKKDKKLTVKKLETDYIYLKPCKLDVVYSQKDYRYNLYVKECEIEYKSKQTLKNVIETMKHQMGKMELIDKHDNKVLWVNKNFASNTIEGFQYEYNLFHVIEYMFLKTNLYDSYFYNNNINLKVIIDKSTLMESEISIQGKTLSKADKEKLVDMFIFELRKEIYPRYIVGKAKGKEFKYNKEATYRGYMFTLDFFKQ